MTPQYPSNYYPFSICLIITPTFGIKTKSWFFCMASTTAVATSSGLRIGNIYIHRVPDTPPNIPVLMVDYKISCNGLGRH
jgi:hypothetical protein